MLKAKVNSIVVILLISVMSVVANAKSDESISIAIKGLSQKLQTDLAINKVNIKLDRVENLNISKEKVIVTGFGVVENAGNLPLTFDVVINPIKRDVVGVKYDIVAPIMVDAKNATEDFLMKKVMGKIKNDYKTNEIVIAIDGFETIRTIDGNKSYVGVAEVRVGMEWSRIEFDVDGNAKLGTAAGVKYKVVK